MARVTSAISASFGDNLLKMGLSSMLVLHLVICASISECMEFFKGIMLSSEGGGFRGVAPFQNGSATLGDI